MDERLGDLLEPTLKKMGIRGQVRDAQVGDIFAKIVGPAISQMCRALRVERDSLVIGTQNSALSHQLQLEAPRLIASLNAELGGPVVRRFRFVPLS